MTLKLPHRSLILEQVHNNRISDERARAAELVRGLALEWEVADYEIRSGVKVRTLASLFVEDARKVAEQIRSGDA